MEPGGTLLVEVRVQLSVLGLDTQNLWEEQFKMLQVEGWPLGWQLFMMVGGFQIQSLLWLCSCSKKYKTAPTY